LTFSQSCEEEIVTHTHTLSWPFVRDYFGGPVPEDTILDFILRGMGKTIKSRMPMIRLHATPSGPSMPHLHLRRRFTPDALPAATLPIYHGLGQAPNMLDMHTWRLG